MWYWCSEVSMSDFWSLKSDTSDFYTVLQVWLAGKNLKRHTCSRGVAVHWLFLLKDYQPPFSTSAWLGRDQGPHVVPGLFSPRVHFSWWLIIWKRQLQHYVSKQSWETLCLYRNSNTMSLSVRFLTLNGQSTMQCVGVKIYALVTVCHHLDSSTGFPRSSFFGTPVQSPDVQH